MRAYGLALLCLSLCGCEENVLSHPSPSLESTPPIVTADPPFPAESHPPASQPTTAAPTKDVAVAAETPAASPAPDKAATLDINFDDLKFEIEKDGKFDRKLLTPKIEGYAGKQIKMRGYILPASCFRQTGNTSFVLVRDNQECCFGPGAALYDCIVVEMEPGKSADFSTRPVAVEGTFAIKEFLDFDGVVRGIYHMDGKSAK